jgi:hypothetical protein
MNTSATTPHPVPSGRASRDWTLTLSLAISLLLGGCSLVLSVDPIILESEAAFDPRLIGSWEGVDSSERATITHDGKEYSIEYTEGAGPPGNESSTHLFGGRLGRLGERLVLDVWPEREGGSVHDALLLPAHLLIQIEIEADEIRMATLDHDAMAAALERGGLSLAHSRREEGDLLLLLASSSELRSALGPYLETPEALEEPMIWRRVSAPQVTAAAPPDRAPRSPACRR